MLTKRHDEIMNNDPPPACIYFDSMKTGNMESTDGGLMVWIMYSC